MKFKYIVIENSYHIEIPIIFPTMCLHSDLALNFHHKKIIAAGEVQIVQELDLNDLTINCFGESIGLKVKSRGREDSDLIRQHGDFLS
jgi:hypothetical protein